MVLIEVRIAPRDPDTDTHTVEIRCSDGSPERTGRTIPGAKVPDVFPQRPREAGEDLFRWVFSDPALAEYWNELRARYPSRRIHWNVDRYADVHQTPWELLRDPNSETGAAALAEQDATPFSRYLKGRFPGPVDTRPIRVLVAIADPENLKEKWRLYQIRREEEWAQLAAAIDGLSPGNVEFVRLEGPCTLEAIEKQLRTKPGFDILHVVAHGGHGADGRSFLCLADSANKPVRVFDAAIQSMVSNLLGDDAAGVAGGANPLRLVFLSSCETASFNGWNGLAPKLLECGLPAVVAMQGQVPVTTARQFSRVFYQELLAHGDIDRSSNRARATLRTTQSAGGELPVLYSRVLDGILFAEPERQIRLDELQRFLTEHFDAGKLVSLGAGLGVQLSAGADPAVAARTLIRSLERDGRLEVLLAEAVSRSTVAPKRVERVSLAQELRDRLGHTANGASGLKQVQRIESAAQNGRLAESGAREVVSGLRAVLGKISGVTALMDSSDMAMLGDRVLRFLDRADGKAVYQLTVAGPAVPLLLGAAEVAALAPGETRQLEAVWRQLVRPPLWKRWPIIAAAIVVLLLAGLGLTESVWRWPWRVMPGDLIQRSLNNEWGDDFSDAKSGKWLCGAEGAQPAACDSYRKAAADCGDEGGCMLLPQGVAIQPAIEGDGLYDFGARFNVRMMPGTKRVDWIFWRSQGRSFARFHLAREGKTGGETEVRLNGEWCDSGGVCKPDRQSGFQTLHCPVDAAFDYGVKVAASSSYMVYDVRVNPLVQPASPECRARFLTVEFARGRWEPGLFGTLLFGAADGPVAFHSEVLLHPYREALRDIKPDSAR